MIDSLQVALKKGGFNPGENESPEHNIEYYLRWKYHLISRSKAKLSLDLFDEKEQMVMYINKNTGARKHPNLDKIMAFDIYYAKLREGAKGEE